MSCRFGSCSSTWDSLFFKDYSSSRRFGSLSSDASRWASSIWVLASQLMPPERFEVEILYLPWRHIAYDVIFRKSSCYCACAQALVRILSPQKRNGDTRVRTLDLGHAQSINEIWRSRPLDHHGPVTKPFFDYCEQSLKRLPPTHPPDFLINSCIPLQIFYIIIYFFYKSTQSTFSLLWLT